MELVLATNFDDTLVDRVSDLPVRTFFGGFPVSLTGAGRPPYILPEVDGERFRRHLDVIHRQGREFYATLNSNDLGLQEYLRGTSMRSSGRSKTSSISASTASSSRSRRCSRRSTGRILTSRSPSRRSPGSGP
jgi:hypothetical protein